MKYLLVLLLFAASLSAHAQKSTDCGYNLPVSTATLTATSQLIPAPSSGAIHLCSFTIQVVQGGTPANFGLISGTGAGCATGTTPVTPAFLGVASTSQSVGESYTTLNTLATPAKTALCLSLSAAPTGAVAHVQYAIY